MANESFGPGFFDFFRELTLHNERDWFLANKDRYEHEVKTPLLHLLEELGPKLRKVAPSFVVDPRPNGGSMMRIYRDIRFSKDKTPYKTHAAAHFPHRDCDRKGVPGPGFYLHLGPDESMAGAGLWQPEAGPLDKVRKAIVKSPAAWKKATVGIELGGEKLKKPPRGYDAEHPLIEELKRKDFVASTPLSRKEICSPRFADRLVEALQPLRPMTKFLTEAVGLPY
jgi:uncharacterized protein (TIGR02453 family)